MSGKWRTSWSLKVNDASCVVAKYVCCPLLPCDLFLAVSKRYFMIYPCMAGC